MSRISPRSMVNDASISPVLLRRLAKHGPSLKRPTFRDNFDVINSPQVGLGATLIPSIVPVAGRERLRVTYSTSLVLTVNRDTGAVAITNPNAPNIQLDGYSIRSASSKLNPTNWTSFDDGNLLGGDWRESNPAETRLTELKPDGSGTSQATVRLPWVTFTIPIRRLSLPVRTWCSTTPTRAGAVVTGQIVYSGTRVNNLLLQVDPRTGEAVLRNTSATTVNFDGYDIASVAGSLLAGTGIAWMTKPSTAIPGGRPPAAIRIA